MLHPPPKWNLHQIDGVVDRRRPVLVVLDRQEIVVAGFVIDPVIGSDHGVGIQRRNHVIHDLLLVQPQFGGMDTVDVESKRGIIHVLGYVDFAHARQSPDTFGQHLRGIVGLIQVAAGNLNIDGRGHSGIEDGIHHRTAGEECSHIGILRRDLAAQSVHIVEAGDAMIGVQSGLNGGRVFAGVGGVQRRKVVDHTDIGNHHLQIARHHHVVNEVLDLRDVLLGDLYSRAGGDLDVHGELPGIGAGEKGHAE